MKKSSILIILILSFSIVGFARTKDFKIEYEELTKKEREFLTLTGNRVSKYNLRNIPNDKTFDLSLVYEVYENNEKIKEETIFGMGFGPTTEKIKDNILELNIQDNKIRCISGEDGGIYAYLDMEENINKLSYYSFTEDTNINLNDEVYLFRGVKSDNGFSDTGLGKLSKEYKDSYTSTNELNVFIKLVCEEK